VALGLATMVKLYPALLLPVLFGRRPVRVVTAFVAVYVVSYVPHVLALGWEVVGFLPGYLAEEDYGSVAVAVLRRVRALPPEADHAPAALVMLGAALLVATPVQPWYGLPLAALAALAGRAAWLAIPAAAYPVFFAVVPAGPSSGASWLGTACFGAALVVVAVAARRPAGARPGRRS